MLSEKEILKGATVSKSPNKTGGPVVKSGPTRGKNRSRNEDGKWRKKRSDTGKSRAGKGQGKKEKSGCFLTTAAFEYKGLPDNCYELMVLREFRDSHLMASSSGQSLVDEYYARAPELVPMLEDCETAERVWQDIREVVELVETDRSAAAIERYKLMVEGLEQGLP